MLIAPPSPEHVTAWQADYEEDTRTILKDRPRLSVSQWAEAYRHLGGTSAEKGPWRNRRVPHLVEIMDALSMPEVEEISVMKPSRVGVSEALVLNGTGFYMHQDPSDIIIAMPTADDAETFSRKKLTAAIKSTPVLRDLLPAPRSRDGTNTILQKEYPGGSITLLGTNSPRTMRMRDTRVVFGDEIDAMESTREGDPLDLLAKRADNAPNRKLGWISSPTFKGASRIEGKYEASDKRRYWMPCPHCGEMQVLMFGGKDAAFGLKWTSGRPDTVVYLCLKGCTIHERSKLEMHAGAEWRPDRPEIRSHRGYWFNALISLFDGVRWPRIVAHFLKSKDEPEKLQVFVNQVLAETYEVRGEKVESSSLLKRREVYPAQVPRSVGILTAFVDVQKDWVEVLVRGWGIAQESWRIRHEVIWGDPEGSELWAEVDGVLFDAYHHEAGGALMIHCSLVDSGDRAAKVYEYVKPRQKRNVFASKGDKQVPNAPIIVRAKKPNDAGVKLLTIGTYTTRRRMFGSLAIARHGPRFMHFHRLPDDAPLEQVAAFEAQDAEFFKQFEAEKLMPEKDGRGATVMRYKQVAPRNEAPDLEVGCLAALYHMGPRVVDHLEHWVGEANKALPAPASHMRPAATGSRRRVVSTGAY